MLPDQLSASALEAFDCWILYLLPGIHHWQAGQEKEGMWQA